MKNLFWGNNATASQKLLMEDAIMMSSTTTYNSITIEKAQFLKLEGINVLIEDGHVTGFSNDFGKGLTCNQEAIILDTLSYGDKIAYADTLNLYDLDIISELYGYAFSIDDGRVSDCYIDKEKLAALEGWESPDWA